MRNAVIFSILVTFVFLLAACGGQTTPTSSAAEENFQIDEIIQEKTYTNEISTVRVFDQCQSGGSLIADISFINSISDSKSAELQLGVLGGGDASSLEIQGEPPAEIGGVRIILPTVKAKLEAEVRGTFADVVSRSLTQSETAHIEIPGGEMQESTIVWKETRVKGTINFTDNGEKGIAIYDYRIGWQLVSSSTRKLNCPGTSVPVNIPTSTPKPNILVSEDFQSGSASLISLTGNYSIVEDASQSGNKVLEFNTNGDTEVSRFRLLDPMPANYTASFRVRFTQENLQGRGFVSCPWRASWNYVMIPSQGRVYAFDRITENEFFTQNFVYQTGKWYSLKYGVSGADAYFYLNGLKIKSVDQVKSETSALYVIIGEGSGIVQFDDIIISSP